MIRNILEENDNVQPNDRTMEVLHKEFPQCFNAEGKFDMVALQELLQDKVDLVKEGSGFNFLGKNYASLLGSMDTTTVLVPDTEHNEKPENKDSQNVYISGDNLDALKHLVKSYSGKVKCIYIDPPYNTGSDGFVYNDKFKFTAEELEEKLSISEEQAQRIFAMTTRGAASHAAWLTFMMPRLQYAKDLLSDDGVIFISIDDNEQANLKLLCDYVFGEECFIGNIVRSTGQTTGQDSGGLGSSFDYMLAYSRNADFELNGLELTEKDKLRFQDQDDVGFYAYDQLRKTGSNDKREDRPNMYYGIENPDGEILYPIAAAGYESRWRVEKKTYDNLVKEGFILWKKSKREDGEIWWPYVKYYLDGRTKRPSPLWADLEGNKKAAREVRDLFDGVKVFDYPKPVDLLERVVQIATAPDSIIVDFFGGSSTTAHAVMQKNSEDGGNRKYILVQLQEECKPDSEAAKAGYKTIDQIGMERIKRAAKKIKEQNPLFAGDLGFKHYTLEEPDENTIDQMLKFEPTQMFGDNLLDKFGKDTVLFTYGMRDGYGLTPKFEAIKFGNYTAYLCGKHLYMLDPDFNVEEDLTDLVDKYNKDHSFPADNVVIFGYSFNFSQTDAIKKNLGAITDRNRINVDIRY